ncbi:cold shock domain containing C2 RNA binding [Cricetulus griseus]
MGDLKEARDGNYGRGRGKGGWYQERMCGVRLERSELDQSQLFLEDALDAEEPTALPFSPLNPGEKPRWSGSLARPNACQCLCLGLTRVWVERLTTAASYQAAASSLGTGRAAEEGGPVRLLLPAWADEARALEKLPDTESIPGEATEQGKAGPCPKGRQSPSPAPVSQSPPGSRAGATMTSEPTSPPVVPPLHSPKSPVWPTFPFHREGSRIWERGGGISPRDLPSPLPTKRTRTYSATARASAGPVFKGVCKQFSRSQGHGFITPENGSEDIFVHVSEIMRVLRARPASQSPQREEVSGRLPGLGATALSGDWSDVALILPLLSTSIEGEYVPVEGDEVTYKMCPIPPKNQKFQAVEVVLTQLAPHTPHETWSGQVVGS